MLCSTLLDPLSPLSALYNTGFNRDVFPLTPSDTPPMLQVHYNLDKPVKVPEYNRSWG